MEIQLQCLLGMACKDFTIVAADQTRTMSVVVMKNDENKLYHINDRLMMAVIGNAGDTAQFTQFVTKNIELYQLRNRYTLSTAAAVHFTRKNMADNLRTGKCSMINILVAGFDEPTGGQLYSLDFLGSCVKVPYAVHGLGGQMVVSILDHYHKDTLKEPEAYDILKTCIREIHQRLFISLPNFQVKSISKHGIKELPTISPAAFSHLT